VDGDIVGHALELSIDQMAEDLITSYAKSEKAFPRTPPMRIKKKEIGNITTTERAEITTTAPTSAPSTDGSTY